MKLLIATQVVDKNHPILGFFHRWIEEFAKHFEHIHVIALQTGEYDLPKNVTVHSLGKEKGAGRLQRLRTLYSTLYTLRKQYDAVFVHMNPEYIVLSGWWWRLTGKTLGLWYMHKSVDFKLHVAEKFVQHIFTATPESFRLPSKKIHITGHGIDTDVFTPNTNITREEWVLSVGRLMNSKRHDLAIQAAKESGQDIYIVGTGEEETKLKTLAHTLGVRAHFMGALTQQELIPLYRRAGIFIHTSETGSLDKVVLEALACGCPVVTTNMSYHDMPLIVVEPTPKDLSLTIESKTKKNSPQEMVEYVKKHHDLSVLVPRILTVYQRSL